MKGLNNKIKKFIYIPLIFFGLTTPLNAEEVAVKDKWVKEITIPKGSSQRYLPKSERFAIIGTKSSTWRPVETLTKIKLGDTITGTYSRDSKDKTKSFVVGAIQCSYHSSDQFSSGSQYMWEGKWGCIAGRNKTQILNFYGGRDGRKFDVFTTSPINPEDIVDLSIPTANAIDAVKFQLAEYKCLWQEGFFTLDVIKNMMEKVRENDPEFGDLLISTYKRGTNQKEIEVQNKLIAKMGGCRNMVVTWINMSYSEKEAADFIMLLALDGWFKEEDEPIKDIPLREKSYFNNSDKMIYCKEPLPPMNTLEGSNPNALKVKKHCSCLWNKFAENSWERRVLIKLYKNNYQEGVLRQANAFEKLNRNFGSCGGYEL